MAEVSTAVVAVATKGESQKAKKGAPAVAAAAKKAKTKAAHPPTAEMVTNAIKVLNERGGSSLPAIKKYLAGNYAVDVDRLAPFIKKFLKSAVLSGALIQTKGKGATGSFKLSKTVPKPKAKKTETKEKKPAPSKKVAKKSKKEKEADDSKKQTASPKKVEKKKVEKKKIAAKSPKKGGEVKNKASKKKPGIKIVKATLNSTKVVKPKAAAAAKKGAAKKAPKK